MFPANTSNWIICCQRCWRPSSKEKSNPSSSPITTFFVFPIVMYLFFFFTREYSYYCYTKLHTYTYSILTASLTKSMKPNKLEFAHQGSCSTPTSSFRWQCDRHNRRRRRVAHYNSWSRRQQTSFNFVEITTKNSIFSQAASKAFKTLFASYPARRSGQ